MRSKANSPQGVMKRRDLGDKLIEKILSGNPRRLYSTDCKIKNLNIQPLTKAVVVGVFTPSNFGYMIFERTRTTGEAHGS